MTTPSIKRVGAFSPTSISGCGLWLDGNDPAGTGSQPANGATVSTWIDKSGNSNNGTSGSATFLRDSLGAYINFTGSQYYAITNPNIVVNQYFTVFMVEQIGNVPLSTNYALMGGTNQSDNANLHIIYMTDNAIRLAFWNNDLNSSMSAYGYGTGGTQPTRLWAFSFIANSRNTYLNGTSIGSDSNNTFLSSATGTSIGRVLTQNYYTGKIREVIIYSGTITTTQRQQVEGYLAQKWGLRNNLPGGHPGITSIIYPTPRRTGTVNMTLNVRPYYTEFSLTSIAGCQLWLDAADSTTITTVTGVSQWNDKSGNAYNLTQGTTGSQPTRTENLLNFLSNNHLNIPQAAVNNLSTWSIFFVINPISSTNWIMVKQKNGVNTFNVLSMTYNTNSGGGPQTGSTGFLYWRSFNAGSQLASTGAITTSTLQLCNLTYDGTNLYFYKSGVLEKTTGGSFAIPNDTSSTNYTMGIWIQDGTIINSTITNFRLGEMIVYNSFLNTTQRQQIESYLAQKWGLSSSLPSGHLNLTQPVGTPRFVTQVKQKIQGIRVLNYPTITNANSNITYGGYMFYYFTTVGDTSTTITNTGGTTINTFILGGGGGGGSWVGGGGGAGGLCIKSGLYSGSYTVTVGAGGNGGAQGRNAGAVGGNSQFSTFIGYGGGGGRDAFAAGINGGCGGGGGYGNNSGGSATQPSSASGGFGFAGGYASAGPAGGGGGIGSAGVSNYTDLGISNQNGLNGGFGYGGTSNSTFLDGRAYGGGGGGGTNGNDGTYMTGGLGFSGGGNGGIGAPIGTPGAAGSPGTANTGGGGGGGGNWNGGGAQNPGGNGGSGIVILYHLL